VNVAQKSTFPSYGGHEVQRVLRLPGCVARDNAWSSTRDHVAARRWNAKRPSSFGIGAASRHHEARQADNQCTDQSQRMTIYYAQIDRPARPTSWAKHVKP
jgi:hypothetical protein